MTALPTAADSSPIHHDAPEVVAQRQLVGIWLLIAGDAVIVGSILFTYLYLRGLNTQKQWMPPGVHGASSLLNWAVVVVAGLSGLALWGGERAVRRGGAMVPAATGAAVLALVAAALSALELAKIPRAVNATSGVRQIAGTYASSLLAIDLSNLAHLVLLALLGLAVASRAARGRISATEWMHAKLVRIFWFWVVFAVLLSSALTTVFVASPR